MTWNGRKRKAKSRRVEKTVKKKDDAHLASVAKRVYYKQTETKWRGKQVIFQIKIDTDDDSSSFYANPEPVYLMGRGSNNQTRTGANVQSLMVQNKMTFASNYKFPIFVRIMLLEAKNTQAIPVYNNVIISPDTKSTVDPSFYQRDMHSRINTDIWRPHIDKQIFLYGNSSQPEGWERFCKNINIVKRRKIRLQYEDDQTQPAVVQPIRNNLYWCYLFAYPSNEVLPAQPSADDFIDCSTQTYHFYKDV